jgi:hypothetical protein
MVSGMMTAKAFGNDGRTLHEAVAGLGPGELSNLMGTLPPNAVEDLMMAALQGAPGDSGDGAVQTGMFRALVASGQVDPDSIRDAVSSLSAEQRQELLRELWDEYGGPNDRTTIDQLYGGIGIGPDDIARMIAQGWDDWGSRFLMSLLHRVGNDPVELLQQMMRELAPRKAAATEAVVDMADGMRDQLSDAASSVADAFSSSWGSGAVMGRDVKDGLNSLVSDLESQQGSGDSTSAMKLRSLKALTKTLELGDSSASDAFLSVVGAGDAVGVARFLMKATARDIAGDDLADAEAGGKLRREDFAEFAGQAFGQTEGPDGALMSDMGDTLSGNESGVDLSQFENLVLPSDSEDDATASASDTGAGAGNQGGSPSGGRNALKRGAKSSMKMGLWMGSAGGSDGGNGANGGQNSGSTGRRGREVGTQTNLSGDGMGNGNGNGNGGTGGGGSGANNRNEMSADSRGNGPGGGGQGGGGQGGGGQGGGGQGGRYGSSDGGSGANGSGSGNGGGGDRNGDGTMNGGSDGAGYGNGSGAGARGGDGTGGDNRADRAGVHRSMSTQELAEANSAARERGKQLLTGHNKSLAFISRSLALPPGKQPKPKPSNRGLVVRQINQMFEDKVVADDIDDKENNPRTSLPEFIHEHLIAKSVRTPSCIHLVLETCFECAHLVAYFPPSVVSLLRWQVRSEEAR